MIKFLQTVRAVREAMKKLPSKKIKKAFLIPVFIQKISKVTGRENLLKETKTNLHPVNLNVNGTASQGMNFTGIKNQNEMTGAGNPEQNPIKQMMTVPF